MPGLLEVRRLTKRFGGVQAVVDVSFSVPPGILYAVIGPNGAGKTTLFNLVSGYLAADSGEVRFNGQSIRGWPAHRIARAGLARTFQNLELFPGMTVLENVMVGCDARVRCGWLDALFGTGRQRAANATSREEARRLLALFSLDGVADIPAGSLAYGMQRMVEIVRAFALRPKLLLLDEPAAGLNPAERQQLAAVLRQARAQGVTVLLVEHDVDLVMTVADRILVLDQGRVLAEGTPEEIQTHPAVVAAYLGEEVS